MSWNTTVLVGQSGGPTAAINASLAGAYEVAAGLGARVLGMRFGIEGLLAGRTVELDRHLGTPLSRELLRHTPASWLGSCRYRLPSPESDAEGVYERLFARFRQLGVGAVLYIGGNDSMDTIDKLSAYARHEGIDIPLVGVPKTIDNDLVGTDHTPGYGSAAKYVATSVRELARDSSVYDLASVTFVEIMGRDAGWLAGAACLAGTPEAPSPDLVLLPEVPLSEDAVVGRIAELLDRQKTVVVAVSEGLRNEDGRLMCEGAAQGAGLDAFGHMASLSGISRYLAGITRARLGVKTRAVELSTLQRCASHSASATDLAEASLLGGAAVRAARDGRQGVMVALERTGDLPYQCATTLVDVSHVANEARQVPRDWIADDGMGVTPAFEAYARPLIAGEALPPFVDGLPAHLAPLAEG